MNVDRSTGWMALAALLVMAASALVLIRDFQSEAANHRAVMLARGQTALDALAAGIRAQGRMGRYRHDRLSYIFEELAADPAITGVVLQAADGTTISRGGSLADIEGDATDPVQWTPGNLILRRELAIDPEGHGFGRGRGRAGGAGPGRGPGPGPPPGPGGGVWDGFPRGPYVLAIALDTTGMTAEIRGDWLRLLVALAGMALLVALGSAAAIGVVRRRRLQTELLVAREQTAHQEHLTRLGAGLAHETKNPLGIVRGQAQLIAETPGDGEANRERAERIVDEIDRTVGHINSFLVLARPQAIEPGPVALGRFLERFAALLEEEARQHQVVLVVNTRDAYIRADEVQLRKALLNLVLNSLRACAPGGRIDVDVAVNRDTVALSVRDTGGGIAPEDLPRVTEPYFTRSENGCGLGLTLVDQIARAHGWRLAIESTPGEGTTVTLNGLEKVDPPDA